MVFGRWQTSLVFAVQSFGSHKLGIRLLVVPEIRIANPLTGLFGQ